MTHRWVKYYRNSLADAELLDIKSGEGDQGVFLDSVNEIEDHPSLYQDLSQSAGMVQDDERNKALHVFIAPLYLSNKVEHTKRTKNVGNIYPFWIPATIYADGTAYREENKTPWFVRSVLEPVLQSNDFPVIADIHTVDMVLETFTFAEDDWSDFLDDAETFFKRVTGSSYAGFAVDGFNTCHKCCIIRAKEIVAAWNILSVYDSLRLSDGPIPELLTKILPPYPGNHQALPDEQDLFFNKSHYGQFNNEYPLSNSQRKSLLLFEKEKNGNILAVNGPPGTGKTTLLQTVIANEIVKAAIHGTCPPKIAASSTNNQAISNILDSFKKGKQPERWLPGLHSIGSYLISSDLFKQAEATAKGYQIMTRTKYGLDGFYYKTDLYTFNNKKLEAIFGKCFTDNYPGIEATSVPEITGFLQAKIKDSVEKINHILDVFGKNPDTSFSLTDLSHYTRIIEQLEESLARITRERGELLIFRDQFELFVRKNKSFLHSLIPSLKRSFGRKLILFLAGYPQFSGLSTEKDVEERLIEKIQSLDQQAAELWKELELYKTKYTLLSGLLADYRKERSGKGYRGEYNDFSPVEQINCLLDVTYRYHAFMDAVHFWEGQWLIKQKEDAIRNDNDSIGQNLNRISYLTPLFISTFHTLPRFCRGTEKTSAGYMQKKPLYDFFDILIVDEAGQVSPEIGAASFSLAKKALVVGDIHQIEPVWGIAYEKIDKGNLYASGIIPENEFSDLRDMGVLCSSGTLMHLAQNSSTYESYKGLGGTLLTEHRRCVDEIVAFSNHYVYHDLLQPMVGSSKGFHFKNEKVDIFIPPLGYINVRGTSGKRSGSTFNTTEAKSVALWIKKYGELLLQHYGKNKPEGHSLKDCIAVITPFAEQKKEIYNQLKQHKVDTKITVGTVHALQGAQKPVIIFSPAYGVNHQGPMFFDNGYNMLNVALTRAEQHFIVIGNMSLFNPANEQKPSGGLARYLFRDEQAELPSSFLFEKDDRNDFASRISTLTEHQKCLKRAFVVAEKRLVIVSPFISIKAIQADNLLPDIQRLREKNIEVVIYTDKYLDCTDNHKLKANSDIGRKELVKAGAKLFVLNGIHNKAVAVDDKILMEGSFNWLSASRDENNSRYEVSQVVTDEKEATKQIALLLDELALKQE